MSDVVWIEEPASEQTTACSEIPPPSEDGWQESSSTESQQAQTVKVVAKEEVELDGPAAVPPAEKEEKEEVEEDQSIGSSTLIEEFPPSVSPKECVQPAQLPTESTVLEPTREEINAQQPAAHPIASPNRVRFVEQQEMEEVKRPDNDECSKPTEDGNTKQERESRETRTEEDNNLANVPDTDLQLDEYERKLRQNTKEALELVDRLCEQQAHEQSAKTTRDGATNLTDTHENIFSGADHSAGDEVDVDSLRVNPKLMKHPVDCIVLPGRRVLVLDEDCGLLLLSLETKSIIRAQPSEQWRKPESATFMRETQHVLVLAECSVESTPSSTVDQKPDESTLSNGAAGQSAEQGNNVVHKAPTYERFICRFDMELKLVNKIEAPKFIRDKVVISCRLCYVEPTKSIYLAVSTPTQGFLYELSVENRWTEVYNTRGHNFADVQSFAVVGKLVPIGSKVPIFLIQHAPIQGPVTELLLVETNRNYVLLVSIYTSQVVDRRMIAVCERPETLTIDETGNLFVFDRATCKVGHHSRIYFEKLREIAVVERAHCRISAASGLLAVLNKQFKELKLYRYQ